MTITRIGSNAQYASGWDKAFGGKAAEAAKKNTKKEQKKNEKPAAKKDDKKDAKKNDKKKQKSSK